ncbi:MULTISPECIES: NAD(P)-dependent oxidoreductase [Sphingobacterium]|uniref:Hydroxyacid dehydrogenase n=1 Tax=Sphingobacterium athyrii TaxID=2152717 RepID=A0A363NX61_9SPHI|nr:MULTISPECIES: NAD(P)-dependent oxidoreductase [Sphingobacterium]PUV25310.1 hypothetical protein DCO56_10310 [Sphingobacterium athyrii]QIH34562.1 hypothetical protein G6053_17410 [Sphingobacterium sp. DR205]
MKIVLLDKKYFLSDFPQNEWGAVWEEYDDTPEDKILARLSGAHIALTHGVKLNREIVSKLPDLKMISVNSTGYERIDVEACKEFGVTVCNIKDWCTNSVVEHILSCMFALNRLLPSYHSFVRNGNWKATPYEIAFKPAKELRGSVIGIVGYGMLGKHLKSVCQAMGLTVLVSEHKNRTSVRNGYTLFNQVVRQSDFLVIQTPLSNETYHMISTEEFEMMQDDAYLINCGRGGLIDEGALLKALEQNKIGGAALDVLEAETFENKALLHYKGSNLILSPHIAFASVQSIKKNTEMVLDNVRQYINGSPINVVN